MTNALHILLLEDQPSDAELTLFTLREAGFEPVWKRVETVADYLDSLSPELDVIVADYSLPQFDAPHALQLLRERSLDVPFIVVTGTVTEEAVVECMKQGAADYLLKDRMTRLGQAVSRAMQERRLRAAKNQVEAALRENEARIQRLTESAQDVIYRYRLVPNAGLEYINPAIVTITGYTREECYANPGLLFSLIYEEDEPLLQELIDSGSDLARSVTLRWVHKDGTILWTEQRNVLLRDSAGHVTAIEGIVRDVTERHRAEDALKDSEQRFRSLFEQSPVGISIARDGLRLYANASLARLFGFDDASDLVGASVLDQFAPESRSQVKLWYSQDPTDSTPSAGETLGLRKDGTVFPRFTQTGFIDLPDGKAVVSFTTDLTDQKRLEAEARTADHLRIELEKEKELNQLKEQFTSTVSHEFRTPLAVILTSSELIDRYFDRISPEKRLTHLREIQKQVKIMINLLDDILDYSKAQAGKVVFDPKQLELEAFFVGIVEPMQAADAGTHQITLVNRSQHRYAVLDESIVRHILVNLLSNAIKYSPDGREIRLELFDEKDYLVLAVSDQGIGIPTDDLNRLFEPFHRAKNAVKIKGTGLGMAIVKSNVEAHGGTIAVESQEGVGTTFTVRLPATAHLASV